MHTHEAPYAGRPLGPHGYIDAAASVWHGPMLHQVGALPACSALEQASDDDARAATSARVERSVEALRKLAELAPVNFEHRVLLVEAERLHVEGPATAIRRGKRRKRQRGWRGRRRKARASLRGDPRVS